jgi:bifunctional ADP-heptose synthase (sugar kinase/adenylyltransferase)
LLVVGMNSDERVREEKGPRRPIINEYDRAFMLHNMKGVDYVFIKRKPFTDSAIQILRPNVLVFASDVHDAESHKKLEAKYQKLFPDLEIIFMDRLGKGSSTTAIESEIIKRAKLYE